MVNLKKLRKKQGTNDPNGQPYDDDIQAALDFLNRVQYERVVGIVFCNNRFQK